MLVANQKYTSGDVVSFKMVNGDELVAKIVEHSDTGFSVSAPCTVMPSAQGLGLMQSLFSAKEDCKVFLSNQHVMFHSESLEQMKAHYLKTTTGIEIQAKPGIIL